MATDRGGAVDDGDEDGLEELETSDCGVSAAPSFEATEQPAAVTHSAARPTNGAT